MNNTAESCQTYFVIWDKKSLSGYVLDVYPEERRKYLAEYERSKGAKVIAQFDSPEQAMQALWDKAKKVSRA
jgi:hypothetical protein